MNIIGNENTMTYRGANNVVWRIIFVRYGVRSLEYSIGERGLNNMWMLS